MQLGYIRSLDGSPIYAAYHASEGASAKLPVVICPPLFEERKSSYAALRNLAATLAGAGHPVMRFDYRGSGESGGVAATRRLQHLAEDVAVARKTLARLSGKRDAALLGLRMGATLVLQETLRAGGEAVVALAPIVKGAAQVRMWRMRSKIRAELTTAQSGSTKSSDSPKESQILDFDGFDVHPLFFDDIAAIDLAKDLGRLSCPGLVMQLSHRSDATPESIELLKTLDSRARLQCLRMESFWDKLDDVETAAMNAAVIAFLASI